MKNNKDRKFQGQFFQLTTVTVYQHYDHGSQYSHMSGKLCLQMKQCTFVFGCSRRELSNVVVNVLCTVQVLGSDANAEIVDATDEEDEDLQCALDSSYTADGCSSVKMSV